MATTPPKQLNWIDAGASAMAIADNIMKHLMIKGVISAAERDQILDAAIVDLSASPQLAQAADNIRVIFNRP